MNEINSMCPLCNRKTKDPMRHLFLSHEINNIEEFNAKLLEVQQKKTRQEEFGNYVRDLKEKVGRGIISLTEYRKLIMEWDNQH